MHSFSKADRLLKRNEFNRLFKNGKKVQNSHFICVYGAGTTDRCRMGITVSKKVGNAPVRNRIKRLVREFFRLNRHLLTGNRDISIIAKHHASGLTSHQTFESLTNLFKKVEYH